MSEYSIYEKICNEKGLRDADVSRGTGIVPSTIDKEVSKIAQTVFDNQNIRLIVEGARTLHDNEQEYVLNLIKLLNSKH